MELWFLQLHRGCKEMSLMTTKHVDLNENRCPPSICQFLMSFSCLKKHTLGLVPCFPELLTEGDRWGGNNPVHYSFYLFRALSSSAHSQGGSPEKNLIFLCINFLTFFWWSTGSLVTLSYTYQLPPIFTPAFFSLVTPDKQTFDRQVGGATVFTGRAVFLNFLKPQIEEN